MAFAVIEDYRGSIEAVVFPKVFTEYGSMLIVDEVLGFEGKFDNSRGKASLQLDKIISPDEFENNSVKEVHIRLSGRTDDEEELYELRNTLIHHTGNSPVFFHLKKKDDEIIIRASNHITVDPNTDLFETVKMKPEVSDVWKE